MLQVILETGQAEVTNQAEVQKVVGFFQPFRVDP